MLFIICLIGGFICGIIGFLFGLKLEKDFCLMLEEEIAELKYQLKQARKNDHKDLKGRYTKAESCEIGC